MVACTAVKPNGILEATDNKFVLEGHLVAALASLAESPKHQVMHVLPVDAFVTQALHDRAPGIAE